MSPDHPNAAAIRRFYDAFGRKDGAAMAELYAPDATFSDPVFPGLPPGRVVSMWKMLTSGDRPLRIEASGIEADDERGRAHWEAWYTFPATGRAVHNVIDATFTFRDGQVVAHEDVFDFWRWSRQALGPAGLLLGWTPLVRNRVRGEAAKGLSKFVGKAG